MRIWQNSSFFVSICSVLLLTPLQGLADNDSKDTNSIPLFASFLEQDVPAADQAAANGPTASIAAGASRMAQVSINTNAINAAKITAGDTVSVGLFDNTSLEATIDKVEVSNKVTSIRGQVNGSTNGYIITTVYENKVLTVIELPAQGYQYKIVYDSDLKTHFLYKTPLSELDNLEGAPSLIAPPLSNDSRSLYDSNAEIVLPAATTTIDVMVVYTPAAASWALADGTNINNVIAQAMAKAQLALDNSNTSINMQLVHSAEVSYTEDGYSNDLDRLTDTSDGYIDNVHTLRDQYGADLVAMFTLEDVVGGVGWLLQDRGGLPEKAFCLVRVQQAAWTYTHIHEMGHNMGAHHHKDQNFQPGPTTWWDGLWDANTWSAGWRWVGSDTGRYCTLMTYTSGGYFEDGLSHSRTAYFSNPDIDHQDAATGDAADGNNARTLREIRSVIAAYRATAAPECTVDANCDNGEVCSNNNTCVVCNDDEDCTDGEVCSNSNTCVECADDGDCTDGTCTNNVCIDYECTVNDNCTGNDVCSNHVCVECAVDGDCTDGTCTNNVCIPYECTINDHCSGDDVCSNHVCVECASNTDCDGDDVCSNNNTCVECTNSADCDGNDVCLDYACVECAVDGDCTDGTCENNVCIDYECLENDDCSGDEVCSNHECVECANDNDCSDALYCNGQEDCVGGLCFSGTEPCEADELCNEETDQCVEPAECEEDNDCAGGVCLDSNCVECKVDGDCIGEVCSEDNMCVECAVDDDCNDGVCSNNNVCIECKEDNDCADGVCEDNLCIECKSDNDCSDGLCLNKKCVECADDDDCTDGICLDTICVECADDDDCTGGICLDTMCVECEVDADCDRGTCINTMCAVVGEVTISKFTVKAGKNGKGDSLKFSGLIDASGDDFNAAWLGNVVVTINAEHIPDTDLTTFTFPIKNDYLKKLKYKSPKIKPLDKTAPVSSLQIDTVKRKLKFSGKNLDLSGLSCPITLTIQIGDYAATKELGEDIVNGEKKPCPTELLTDI